jgi:hypothetical protein
VEKALPLLSNENYNLFNDASKMKTMHIHQLHGKEDILRQIFKEYQDKMDNPEMLELSDNCTEVKEQMENIQSDIDSMKKQVEAEYE